MNDCFKASVTGALLLLLECGVGSLEAYADQTLETLRQGMKVNLQNNLPKTENLTGQPFDAILPNNVHYRDWLLPRGTHFRGEVIRSKPSRHFNRPGYVVLQTHEVEFPNGHVVALDGNKIRKIKVYNPDSVTFSRNVFEQLPFTAVGSAVSIPLRVASFGGVGVVPINIAARATVGAIWGYYDPHNRHREVPARIAYGIDRGLGVITVNRFLKKLPAPDFHTGDTIPLYLPPQELKTLFEEASATVKDPTDIIPSLRNQQASDEAGQPDKATYDKLSLDKPSMEALQASQPILPPSTAPEIAPENDPNPPPPVSAKLPSSSQL